MQEGEEYRGQRNLREGNDGVKKAPQNLWAFVVKVMDSRIYM